VTVTGIIKRFVGPEMKRAGCVNPDQSLVADGNPSTSGITVDLADFMREIMNKGKD